MATVYDLLGAVRPDTVTVARGTLDDARRQAIQYFPSPQDWRDEVLYFLLPDRFSDGKEATRPLLTRNEIVDLRIAASRPGWNWHDWAESGKRWQGGNINGIKGRLPYLKQLGITAIWAGPIFKQRARLDTYHGYGIQDFLDVDPRFGTRRDLIDLVAAAHALGIRIILDIIVNHSGDNWGYVAPGKPVSDALNQPGYRNWPDHYGNPGNPEMSGWTIGFRNETQQGFTTQPANVLGPHEGAWPREFLRTSLYTRAGMGDLTESDIKNPHAPHKRTDFFTLKDFALDSGDTLSFLADCYKYWIALTDCDGFRIDTVKHMALEETRNFCGSIREFADSIGKRNFLLVGEIAGGDYAQDYVLDNLAILQRNLSAALDIGSARGQLQSAAKGLAPGSAYLDEFKEAAEGFESHRSLGNRHVSILDDHDHVFGAKVRFSADIPDDSPVKDYQVTAATAMQLFTLGIPCIYYGTEQAFAGPALSQRQYVQGEGWNDGGKGGDRFLREAMFGPEHPRAHHDGDLATQIASQDASLPGFGPFGTAGEHCFDTSSPAYKRIAHLCATRAKYPVLRVGRQYARQTRTKTSDPFALPPQGELVAWSRILDSQEALIVVNANGNLERCAEIIVSAEVSANKQFTVVANTAEAAAGAGYKGLHPAGEKIDVKGRSTPDEPAYIQISSVMPAEVLVLVREY